MKKIYNAPTSFCVELRTLKMMSLSLNNTDPITSSNMSDYEQNVKENNPPINDVNVWDDEW